jgi:hypothetical protein
MFATANCNMMADGKLCVCWCLRLRQMEKLIYIAESAPSVGLGSSKTAGLSQTLFETCHAG